MRYAGIGRVGALALIWGSGFLWIKIGLRGFTPAQILVARLALGSLVLVPVIYLRRGALPTGRSLWLRLTGAALFGNTAPYLLFALGERQVDSSVAGMLNATTPLWTVLLALVVRHQRTVHMRTILGLTLGTGGSVLLIAPWQAGSQFVSLGALACLLAAFSYAVSYVYIARYLSGTAHQPLTLAAGQLITATALALHTFALPESAPASPRADAIVSVLILGALGTGLAYVINYRIIADDGPVAASAVIYLLPAVAVLLGALGLGEHITLRALAGLAILLAGVALVRSTSHQPASSVNATSTGSRD